MVRESTAPFEAAYQTYSPGEPSSAATEEMLTIALACAASLAIRARAASRATRIAPVTLMSMHSRIAAMSASASVPDLPVMPALLTTWLSGPSAGRGQLAQQPGSPSPPESSGSES